MGHLYVLILNIITQYASFPFIPTPPMYSIPSLFSHSVPKAEEISRKMGWKDYNSYNRETGSLPWDYVSYMILMISPKSKMGALAKSEQR